MLADKLKRCIRSFVERANELVCVTGTNIEDCTVCREGRKRQAVWMLTVRRCLSK